ncbi:MAG: polysaccharide deacetylase family protein [Woeseiaceae bacterium]|nr:polysaccharide deacetylase family protein [Woeseiaceae bacterium]
MRLWTAILALAAFLPAAAGETDVRTIALTFDDATRGDGPVFTGEQRTTALIESLEAAGVDGAMFFVTTRNVQRQGETGTARLNAYTAAGHTLANHSHTHPWLHRTDADDYIADIDIATEILAEQDNVEPFYRYPFLDEGRAVDKRDRLREALAERDLQNGYVTVDTYDWYLEALLTEAHEAGVEIDMEKLGSLYVDVIVRSTEFYDSMAQETLGRSPHHVLLLHENDVAALFIDDLVERLREHGFRIIPATVAFEDPISEREPDTLFLGQGRIAALAHEAGRRPAELVSPTEDEAYLRSRFEREVAALPAP